MLIAAPTLINAFTPQECANDFKNAGYASNEVELTQRESRGDSRIAKLRWVRAREAGIPTHAAHRLVSDARTISAASELSTVTPRKQIAVQSPP